MRGGTSRLVFAEACDSEFRHASDLSNPFRVKVKYFCFVHRVCVLYVRCAVQRKKTA